MVLGLGSLASAITSSVGVVALSGQTTVLDGVGEGVVHQTTVAALVTLRAGAVHELLLRQRDKIASGNLVGTLDRTGGGERPARAALTLVLDGGDGTLGTPIHKGQITKR